MVDNWSVSFLINYQVILIVVLSLYLMNNDHNKQYFLEIFKKVKLFQLKQKIQVRIQSDK